MGSPSPASPVTQTTQISQMDPRLYQWLYGTANSPGRQQIANAAMLGKTMQGVQNADPTALAAYYNVPKGTDLSQFQSHTGAMNPGQADPSLMQFPGRSITPQDYYKEATAGEKKSAKDPVSTALAAKGGELEGYAKGGKPKEGFDEQGNLTPEAYSFLQNKIQSGKKVGNVYSKGMKAYEQAHPAASDSTPSGNTDLSLRDAQIGVTPFYDPKTMQSTNPYYNQAVDVLKGMGKAPEEYGKASDAYSNLQKMADFTPQQIAAQSVTGSSISPIANITAPEAVASSYSASQMAGPQNVSAQGYDAAQMQAATMQGAQDIQANRLNQYQMDRDRIKNLQAQRAAVAEMTGPESWAQRGVAEKYMNPYVKTALKSQQELANYDLQENLNKIMGQAAGAGAFGGSRTQLQLANTRMNQDLANRNMAAQGLSQAYTQGMGQFTTEQQMSQVAKQANQAAANAANLDYVARKYAAEAANQGMDYNTALQNLQAKLGVQQAQQAADLQAAQANQLYGYGGFQSQAQNLASLNTTAANNMQAINNQRSQYVTQALQAAQANQQAQLTTEQQNMIARNAAGQFNAQNATQISQANAQMGLQAAQSNQQTAYNTAAQNAQLAQQANLANQQAALTAATQNQQAGLSANQQNLSAMGQAGQGLLGVGQGIGAYNQNLLQNWGAAGNTLQNLAQGYYDKRQQGAQNLWGGVNTATQPATGTLLGSPWGTSYQGQYQQRKKGGKLSIKL